MEMKKHVLIYFFISFLVDKEKNVVVIKWK
jgi:hypothetical protein